MNVLQKKTTSVCRLFVLAALSSVCFSLPLSAQGVASTATLGVGCGFKSVPPELQSSRPVLEHSLVILGSHLSPGGIAFVVFSTPPQAPLALSNGCELQVDPAFLLPVGPYLTDATGGFLVPALLPADPALEGFQLALQVVNLSAADVSQFEVTNGLLWTLGSL